MFLKIIILLIIGVLLSGCIVNPEISAGPDSPITKEYKIYSISKETQQGGLFEDSKTYYVVFYIDTDNSIKRISGASDDNRNLLNYKLSGDNHSKLVKIKFGFFYDEWDVYLPRDDS